MLRHYREASGLSQSEVAEKLNIGLRSYQRYESGESVPSVDLVFLMSKVLDFELKDMFDPQSIVAGIQGFKLFNANEEAQFKDDPDIVESKLLDIFHSEEFNSVLIGGEIKKTKEIPLFRDSLFPLSFSTPKTTILNPTAQKLTGFNHEVVPTPSGQTSPRELGSIWAVLLDKDKAFFHQETFPNFPKGKSKMLSKGAFCKIQNNYGALALLDIKPA
ncbi:MAG: helix-turn-helix transcriptional regulator [Bacteriovoracia bacterium]